MGFKRDGHIPNEENGDSRISIIPRYSIFTILILTLIIAIIGTSIIKMREKTGELHVQARVVIHDDVRYSLASYQIPGCPGLLLVVSNKLGWEIADLDVNMRSINCEGETYRIPCEGSYLVCPDGTDNASMLRELDKKTSSKLISILEGAEVSQDWASLLDNNGTSTPESD